MGSRVAVWEGEVLCESGREASLPRVAPAARRVRAGGLGSALRMWECKQGLGKAYFPLSEGERSPP